MCESKTHFGIYITSFFREAVIPGFGYNDMIHYLDIEEHSHIFFMRLVIRRSAWLGRRLPEG